MQHIRRFFTLAMLVSSTVALAVNEGDIVKPVIGDKLIAARLTHREMTGGELDRRIMDLIDKNYMTTDQK